MSYTDVFNAVAALSPAFRNAAPQVFNFDALPLTLTTSDLPCRILSPFENRGVEGQLLEFIAPDHTTRTNVYRVTDTLYVNPIAQGSYSDDVRDAVYYAEAYEDELVGAKDLGLDATVIERVLFFWQTEEYPAASGNTFRALVCAVEVRQWT